VAGDEATVGLWTVDAPVLEVPPRPPIAAKSILTSLPPAGGSGVEVRGVDPRSIPGATVYGNGTVLTPALRLTGTYDGHSLTVTEPVIPAPDQVHAEPAGELPGTACTDPGHGQYNHQQRETAISYARAQPDLGAIWFSESMRVLNISFTSNVDGHRQALRAVFPGPLCVVRARVSAAELAAVQRRLHDDDRGFLSEHRIQVLKSGTAAETLHILVVAAGPKQLQLLHDHYGPAVVVTSWLQPAHPTSVRRPRNTPKTRCSRSPRK
jgi:hypothetical protein